MANEKVTKAATETAAAAALGEQLARTVTPVDLRWENKAVHPFFIVPEGLSLHDCETHLAAPLRLKQRVKLDEPDSFVQYVRLFGRAGATMVFVDRAAAAYTAALDYHADVDAPSWVAHKATLSLTPTLAWTEWSGANKTAKNQVDFAQFVEDHMPDIVTPSGADLMEVAVNFEARKAVQFSSAVRLQDGTAQLTYAENAVNGSMKIPTTFVIRLSVYRGTPPVDLTARLRYSIGAGGVLKLWFDILRLEDARQAVVDAMTDALTEAVKGSVRAVVVGAM